MSDDSVPPPPPPPDDEIPPPPPPPPDDDDEEEEEEEILGAEIDFEKLAARAAKIAARANQRHERTTPADDADEEKKKNKRKRENAEGATTTTTTIATMPAPPVKTVLDEVDEKRMENGDRVWGIALSSCLEYPNKKYFFSRKDSRAERVCQWETPKELKGGLQKNLRICPLKATLLAQNTMPESGWVELTTSVPVCDDDEEEEEEREREREKEGGAKKNKNKTTRAAKYYWHPATKRVTWTRPRRDESEVSEAEILPLAGPS